MKFLNSQLLALSLGITYAAAAIHQVLVGGDTLAFTPNFVEAAAGDDVVFVFGPKNHTVTQSSFETPCSPMSGGLDSGFRPSTGPPFPAWSVRVGDATKPFWFYCKQGTHCSSAGMVFAINPGARFAQFQAAATGGSVSSTPAPITSSSVAPAPTSAPPPTTTAPVAPPAPGQDHLVLVGDGGSLAFSPNNLNAAVGDTITFEFRAKNHTATQSSFGSPCRPLSATSLTGQTGFDSGFLPVAAGVASFPRFTVKVNDTSPIWAFCAQANHCTQGMVFAANAPTTGNTFDAFVQAAKSGGGSSTSMAPTSTQTAAASSLVTQSHSIVALVLSMVLLNTIL